MIVEISMILAMEIYCKSTATDNSERINNHNILLKDTFRVPLVRFTQLSEEHMNGFLAYPNMTDICI